MEHSWRQIADTGGPGLCYQCKICGEYDAIGADLLDTTKILKESKRIRGRRDCQGYFRKRRCAHL